MNRSQRRAAEKAAKKQKSKPLSKHKYQQKYNATILMLHAILCIDKAVIVINHHPCDVNGYHANLNDLILDELLDKFSVQHADAANVVGRKLDQWLYAKGIDLEHLYLLCTMMLHTATKLYNGVPNSKIEDYLKSTYTIFKDYWKDEDVQLVAEMSELLIMWTNEQTASLNP